MTRTTKILILTSLLVVACLGLVAAKNKSNTVAWLGVYTQSVDYDLAEDYDLSVDYGAIIDQVEKDSPAEEAGLQEDDIIIALDNRKVTDTEELSDRLWDHEPDDEVTVTYVRDGAESTVSVKLGEQRRSSRHYWSHRSRSNNRWAPIGNRAYRWQGETRGYMGVTLMDLSDQLADYFGVNPREGTLVTEVEEDSPAWEAGIRAGDVIMKVADENVFDPGDVTDILRDYREDDVVTVSVIREKQSQSFDVTLEERRSPFGHISIPDIPNIPDIHVDVPKMRGIYHLNNDPDNPIYFDSREFREELQEAMEELREELKELGQELEEIKKR